MDFSTVNAISLEGKDVIQIKDSDNNILWQKQGVVINIDPQPDVPGDIDYDEFEELL